MASFAAQLGTGPAPWSGYTMTSIRLAEILGGAAVGLGLSRAVLAIAPTAEAPTLPTAVVISLITAAITAVGTTFFQPWLRTKDLAARNAGLEADLASLRAEVSKLTEVNRRMAEDLARLAEQAIRVGERNGRLAHVLLVSSGHIAPGSAAGTLVHPGHAPPATAAEAPAVLLVGDDGRVSEAMLLLLERSGYRVLSAGDKEEAAAILETASGVAAVVVDVGTDPSLARDVLWRIRSLGLSVRVVLTAGAGVPTAFADEFRPGAILSKPFDFEKHLLPALRGE